MLVPFLAIEATRKRLGPWRNSLRLVLQLALRQRRCGVARCEPAFPGWSACGWNRRAASGSPGFAFIVSRRDENDGMDWVADRFEDLSTPVTVHAGHHGVEQDQDLPMGSHPLIIACAKINMTKEGFGRRLWTSNRLKRYLTGRDMSVPQILYWKRRYFQTPRANRSNLWDITL